MITKSLKNVMNSEKVELTSSRLLSTKVDDSDEDIYESMKSMKKKSYEYFIFRGIVCIFFHYRMDRGRCDLRLAYHCSDFQL